MAQKLKEKPEACHSVRGRMEGEGQRTIKTAPSWQIKPQAENPFQVSGSRRCVVSSVKALNPGQGRRSPAGWVPILTQSLLVRLGPTIHFFFFEVESLCVA